MKKIVKAVTTIIGSAALLLATTGIADAQEAAPQTTKKQVQNQAKKGNGTGQSQEHGAQNKPGSTGKLGPGDSTGNHGIKPQDGTGNGSPQQAGFGNGKATKNGKAAKNGKGQSASKGSVKGTSPRSRARAHSGSRDGSCTGSGARSRRGSRGSGGSGGGGRR